MNSWNRGSKKKKKKRKCRVGLKVFKKKKNSDKGWQRMYTKWICTKNLLEKTGFKARLIGKTSKTLKYIRSDSLVFQIFYGWHKNCTFKELDLYIDGY